MKEYRRLLRQVSEFCHQNLLRNSSVKQYLYNRGILDSSIKKFQLGYFPGGMKELFKIVDAQKLMYYKLIYGVDRGPLQQRIVFPIYSQYGEIIAIGGRPPCSEEDRKKKCIEPKYWNTGYAFNKAKSLYGLDSAIPWIREANICFVGEGYFDTIMAHQYGIKNFVSTGGTLFTQEQIVILARYASRVVAVFDADNAGISAMQKIEQRVRVGTKLARAQIESDEDVDSFLRKYGKERFIDAIDMSLQSL